jgi:hypothetical protein
MRYSTTFTAALPLLTTSVHVGHALPARRTAAVTGPCLNTPSSRHACTHPTEHHLDADILNFALTLEHLENAFYQDGLNRFSADDFSNQNYGTYVRDRFEEIAAHEATHVEFLTTALKTAGIPPVEACTYKL